MAITISKKEGTYKSQTFVDDKTILSEANVKPIDKGLEESSDVVKNIIDSFFIAPGDWTADTVNGGFKVDVKHNFNSTSLTTTVYRVVGSKLEAEFTSTEIVDSQTFKIWNDEKINAKCIVTFELL